MNYFLPLLFILTTMPVSLPAVPDDPPSLAEILKNHVAILNSNTRGRSLTDISGQAGSNIHQYGNYLTIGYKF